MINNNEVVSMYVCMYICMNVYRELGEGDRISNRVLEKKFLSFYEIFEEISI